MVSLKKRLLRELDTLSSGELLAVQQLIDSFKRRRSAPPVDQESVQRVRAALAHLPGSLSEVIVQEEREERI